MSDNYNRRPTPTCDRCNASGAGLDRAGMGFTTCHAFSTSGQKLYPVHICDDCLPAVRNAWYALRDMLSRMGLEPVARPTPYGDAMRWTPALASPSPDDRAPERSDRR